MTQTLRAQPPWLVLCGALLLVGAIGWVDFITDWEWSFFAPYPIPIVLVVWRFGRRAGLAFALLCAITWWLSHLKEHPYHAQWEFALAVVGWWFYFSVLVVTAAVLKTQLEMDCKQIESLERTQHLEREILRTSELEQQRIGRDLHDSLGPHLAAIRYAASFLADELRQRGQPETAKADRIGELASDAVALARDLAQGLCPVQLESAGLPVALEDLALTSSKRTGMAVSYRDRGEPAQVNPEVGMNLYRIAQEGVNNAAKHGGARHVGITFGRHADSLCLSVVDDGAGIPATSDGMEGMGLYSMRFRARVLGGLLKIAPNPGGGTIVSCEIPDLPPEPGAPVP